MSACIHPLPDATTTTTTTTTTLDGNAVRQLAATLESADAGDAGDDPRGLADLDVLSRTVLQPLLDQAVVSGDPAALLRCLHVGVPLWIHLANDTSSPLRGELLLDWRTQAATALARPQDMLVGSQQRQRAANLLADFTRGMAALALQPGGVTFAGIIFCAQHSPDGVAARDTTERCPRCPRRRAATPGAQP